MTKKEKCMGGILLALTFGVAFAAGVTMAGDCPENPECDPIEVIPAPPCPECPECPGCPECPPDLPEPKRTIYQQRCPSVTERKQNPQWEKITEAKSVHPFRWDMPIEYSPEGNAASVGLVWNRWQRLRPMVRVSHDFDSYDDTLTVLDFCREFKYWCDIRDPVQEMGVEVPDETRVWFGAVIGLGKSR
jgi:hypothetical protein